ncbi:vesicle-associated protein 1-4 [Sesamum indicum]|uniref:Vesicle-associated protein 1-4 n=1 Tax=Sesamum indicum TaxID=4182 RepID=A0A6I9SSK9_SESIN|nr:vesicle-associated protein 1-4 [Sesamum indicum]
MGTEQLLGFEPPELSFPFELDKQLSCSMRLLNKTENHVAFKLLTTNPKKYGVRPRIGILAPGSACDITVTMRAVKEAPQNMRCKDKFMIQSAVASPDATKEDALNMFNRDAGHVFQESKLRVVYSNPTVEAPAMENPNPNGPEMRKLLDIQPSKLQFPLSLNKELSSSLQLSNVTDNHVAFRISASPKYLVQPKVGIILPQSTCDITVRMQAQNKVLSEMQSEDKFLIQSVTLSAGTTTEDNIADAVFDGARFPIEEREMQVVYIPKQENKSADVAELILRGIVVSLLGLVSCYLMKQTLSLIWSLAMVGTMLMFKMIKKLVSDSVEDWIVKTLLYIFMHLLFGRKENIHLSRG